MELHGATDSRRRRRWQRWQWRQWRQWRCAGGAAGRHSVRVCKGGSLCPQNRLNHWIGRSSSDSYAGTCLYTKVLGSTSPEGCGRKIRGMHCTARTFTRIGLDVLGRVCFLPCVCKDAECAMLRLHCTCKLASATLKSRVKHTDRMRLHVAGEKNLDMASCRRLSISGALYFMASRAHSEAKILSASTSPSFFLFHKVCSASLSTGAMRLRGMSSAVMAAMMASLSCVAASWCSTGEYDVVCVRWLILPTCAGRATYRVPLRVPVACIAYLYRLNGVLGFRQVSHF